MMLTRGSEILCEHRLTSRSVRPGTWSSGKGDVVQVCDAEHRVVVMMTRSATDLDTPNP